MLDTNFGKEIFVIKRKYERLRKGLDREVDTYMHIGGEQERAKGSEGISIEECVFLYFCLSPCFD